MLDCSDYNVVAAVTVALKMTLSGSAELKEILLELPLSDA